MKPGSILKHRGWKDKDSSEQKKFGMKSDNHPVLSEVEESRHPHYSVRLRPVIADGEARREPLPPPPTLPWAGARIR